MDIEPRNQIDALIFDMDGVLVDVSRSYRAAIIRTVDIYFAQGLRLPANGTPLLSPDDVATLKNAGGFNNDWDLTAAFITYFLDMLPPMHAPTLPLHRRVTTMMAYLEMCMRGKAPASIAELRTKKDVPALANAVADAGGGLDGLKIALARKNAHMVFSRGDLRKENLVRRIFQEIYLGETLFAEIYGEKPIIVREAGVITDETPLIAPATLATLAEKMPLAIATGRPRAEADFTLNRLGFTPYFGAMVTHDDVVAADAQGKPDPWSLREAAQRLTPAPARCAYIGDTPDDIRAAKAAGYTAIGVLATATDPAALRAQFESLGADTVLESPDELREFVAG